MRSVRIAGLVTCASVFAFSGPTIASTRADVEKLSQKCTQGKAKSCQKLVEIAKKDKDVNVSMAALKRLTDQASLAEVARASSYSSVREQAVGGLADQSILAAIAKSDSDVAVRLAAVTKLRDETVLSQVAKSDADTHVRATAAHRLTDQALLAEIFNGDKDWTVRLAAVDGIADPAALAEIQGALDEIASTDDDIDIRFAATEGLYRARVRRFASEVGWTSSELASAVTLCSPQRVPRAPTGTRSVPMPTLVLLALHPAERPSSFFGHHSNEPAVNALPMTIGEVHETSSPRSIACVDVDRSQRVFREKGPEGVTHAINCWVDDWHVSVWSWPQRELLAERHFGESMPKSLSLSHEELERIAEKTRKGPSRGRVEPGYRVGPSPHDVDRWLHEISDKSGAPTTSR